MEIIVVKLKVCHTSLMLPILELHMPPSTLHENLNSLSDNEEYFIDPLGETNCCLDRC